MENVHTNTRKYVTHKYLQVNEYKSVDKLITFFTLQRLSQVRHRLYQTLEHTQMRAQGIFIPQTGHCKTAEPPKLQFLCALPYPPSPWGALNMLKKKTSVEYAAE